MAIASLFALMVAPLPVVGPVAAADTSAGGPGELAAGSYAAADYTAASWAPFAEALSSAAGVADDPSATSPEVAAAKTELQTSAAELEPLAADGFGSTLFENTGGWSTWRTKAITVPLSVGDNTIRLVATGSGGLPNIDYLDHVLPDDGDGDPVRGTRGRNTPLPHTRRGSYTSRFPRVTARRQKGQEQ